MRGLIDRITNRDVIEELEATIQEKELLIKERNDALQEFEEKADTLSGVIRVLKMRFDTIFPASKVERKVDERDSKPN